MTAWQCGQSWLEAFCLYSQNIIFHRCIFMAVSYSCRVCSPCCWLVENYNVLICMSNQFIVKKKMEILGVNTICGIRMYIMGSNIHPKSWFTYYCLMFMRFVGDDFFLKWPLPCPIRSTSHVISNIHNIRGDEFRFFWVLYYFIIILCCFIVAAIFF